MVNSKPLFLVMLWKYSELLLMGEEHNVTFGQGLKVKWAKSTLSSASICLMRQIEGEERDCNPIDFEPLSKNYITLFSH